MKISKLLNKKNFLISFILFIGQISYAEDQPVDIWNIDKKKTEINSSSNKITIEQPTETKNSATDIYKMQSQKKIASIELDQNLKDTKIKIIGLYDPEDYGLDINMWVNSDGDQLKNIFNKLSKLNLSVDAEEIMKISLLTNAHIPKKIFLIMNFYNLDQIG